MLSYTIHLIAMKFRQVIGHIPDEISVNKCQISHYRATYLILSFYSYRMNDQNLVHPERVLNLISFRRYKYIMRPLFVTFIISLVSHHIHICHTPVIGA